MNIPDHPDSIHLTHRCVIPEHQHADAVKWLSQNIPDTISSRQDMLWDFYMLDQYTAFYFQHSEHLAWFIAAHR